MLITLESIVGKYNVKVDGVLHVGAHHGEEAAAYAKMQFSPVYWVEAEEDSFKILQRTLRRYNDQFAIQAVVADEEKEVTFNHANNGQSSSLLEFGTHSKEHPDVVFTGATVYQATTVDQLLFDGLISPCNFVNLDIQGAELMALQGATEYLGGVDYVYTEVNKKELYKGCVLLPQLDSWLAGKGFTRVELAMTVHGWGDAFYVRQS